VRREEPVQLRYVELVQHLFVALNRVSPMPVLPNSEDISKHYAIVIDFSVILYLSSYRTLLLTDRHKRPYFVALGGLTLDRFKAVDRMKGRV
jgi:hypothetical protein